jgi:hypothetical protein
MAGMRGVGETPPDEPPPLPEDPRVWAFDCVALEVFVVWEVSLELELVRVDVAEVDDVVIEVVGVLAAGDDDEDFEPPHALRSSTAGSSRKRCGRALTIPA